MIPVSIKTYKNCVSANIISFFGSFIDAIMKMIGIALAFGMLSEVGFLFGILSGIVILVASVGLGALIRNGAWKLADMMQIAKLKRKLASLRG